MTAPEFIQTHDDPTTWTTADHEAYDNLRRNDDQRQTTAQTSADRRRKLLAPAA